MSTQRLSNSFPCCHPNLRNRKLLLTDLRPLAVFFFFFPFGKCVMQDVMVRHTPFKSM